MTATNVNAKRLRTFKKKRANINTACPSGKRTYDLFRGTHPK